MKSVYGYIALTHGCKPGLLDVFLTPVPSPGPRPTGSAKCPVETFYCPDGEEIKIDNFTIWNSEKSTCEVNSQLATVFDERCNLYKCGLEQKTIQQYTSWSDGCSADIFSDELNPMFEPMCNIHDRCYITPGTTQKECDLQFLRNMQKRCQIPGTDEMCSVLANLSFQFVSNVDMIVGDKVALKQSCEAIFIW